MNSKTHLASDPRLNWWILYFGTSIYIAVEFGFNYQLLDLTVDLVSEDVLLGLEFWGRVISGVGLKLCRWFSTLRKNRRVRFGFGGATVLLASRGHQVSIYTTVGVWVLKVSSIFFSIGHIYANTETGLRWPLGQFPLPAFEFALELRQQPCCR